MTEIPQELIDKVAALDIRFRGGVKRIAGKIVTYKEISKKVEREIGVKVDFTYLGHRVITLKRYGIEPCNALVGAIIAKVMASQGLIPLGDGVTYGIRGAEILTSRDIPGSHNKIPRKLANFSLGLASADEITGKAVEHHAKERPIDWKGLKAENRVVKHQRNAGTWEIEQVKSGRIRRLGCSF